MKRKFKLKKKVYIILIIFLLIIVGIFITFKVIKNNNGQNNPKINEIILVDNLKFEVNSEVNLLSLISPENKVKIITKDKKIDTSVLGDKKIVIKYKDNDKESKKTFTITIVDTQAPTIEYKTELVTTVGQKIDLLEGVKATDNYDQTIDVNIEGEYDFNKIGTYTIYYVAKDSSDNTTKETATLKVEAAPTKSNNINDNKSNTTQNNSQEFTTSKGYKGIVKNGVTYIDGILIANKTYSLPSTYNPGGLTPETKQAFNDMAAAAALDGINIWCNSGFRSYTTQNRLYNNYVARDGKAAADTYSARAGHSEHQSGLACDINNVINATFNNSAEAQWAAKNAYKYGLILRYPENKTSQTGYQYESWHFRYVGVDLATKLYNNGDWITLEDYFGITSEY